MTLPPELSAPINIWSRLLKFNFNSGILNSVGGLSSNLQGIDVGFKITIASVQKGILSWSVSAETGDKEEAINIRKIDNFVLNPILKSRFIRLIRYFDIIEVSQYDLTSK
jgi:hypothetical protein